MRILTIVLAFLLTTSVAYANQCGTASWYGGKDGLHGKKTASGEIFNTNAMTAAHKTLPLGSIVKVTNPRNHKRITVRINDRGPFAKGRIIDLSRAAADAIGIKKAGVGKVCIERIK